MKRVQYLLTFVILFAGFSALDAYTYTITNSTDHEIDFAVKVSFAKPKSITIKPKSSGTIHFKGIACTEYVKTLVKDPSKPPKTIKESVAACGNNKFEVAKEFFLDPKTGNKDYKYLIKGSEILN